MSSETQSGKLTDELIAKLAPLISFDKMETIALLHLGFGNEDIDRIKTKAGNNAEKFIREVLIKWKNINKEKATVEVCLNKVRNLKYHSISSIIQYNFHSTFLQHTKRNYKIIKHLVDGFDSIKPILL